MKKLIFPVMAVAVGLLTGCSAGPASNATTAQPVKWNSLAAADSMGAALMDPALYPSLAERQTMNLQQQAALEATGYDEFASDLP